MAKRASENMKASLMFDQGKSAEGIIVNLTGRGFVLVCSSLPNAEQALGSRVTLEVAEGEGINEVQAAPGHIQGMRSEDSGHQRVSVWLDDADDLERMVKAGVAANFNRRSAYRVAPALDAPIKLRVSTMDDSWTHEGQACDLSASGVGMLVDAEKAKKLEEAFELKLSIRLPRTRATIEMISHVKRVIPKGNSHLVGFDFDPTNTLNFDNLIDEVIDYIMRRQREELREKKSE